MWKLPSSSSINQATWYLPACFHCFSFPLLSYAFRSDPVCFLWFTSFLLRGEDKFRHLGQVALKLAGRRRRRASQAACGHRGEAAALAQARTKGDLNVAVIKINQSVRHCQVEDERGPREAAFMKAEVKRLWPRRRRRRRPRRQAAWHLSTACYFELFPTAAAAWFPFCARCFLLCLPGQG
jgi:hypothetical protein